MRHVFILVGAMLLFSISAAAQGPAGAGSSGSGARIPFSAGIEGTVWELGIGYQYNRFNLTGTPFNNNGLNVFVGRFLNDWFGIEGGVGMGFGHTGTSIPPTSLVAKSLFAGGGIRMAYRGHGRSEPWIHGLGGLEHFRFTQTAGILGSNSALAGVVGGGIDYHLNPRTAVRLEADAIGSRFFSANQRHFQVVTGLVFNF
jgi:outer membrane protein with beta-barrel domain